MPKIKRRKKRDSRVSIIVYTSFGRGRAMEKLWVRLDDTLVAVLDAYAREVKLTRTKALERLCVARVVVECINTGHPELVPVARDPHRTLGQLRAWADEWEMTVSAVIRDIVRAYADMGDVGDALEAWNAEESEPDPFEGDRGEGEESEGLP